MSELGNLNVGAETQQTGQIAPETRLFRHIILTAVLDAIYGSSDGRAGEDQRIRSEAMRWFANAGDDFHFVCEFADLHPPTVQKRALRYIEAARADPPVRRRRPSLHPIARDERRAA